MDTGSKTTKGRTRSFCRLGLLHDPHRVSPWNDHSVTVCIPHVDTPGIVGLSVRAWLLQQLCPFLLVIDTGSVSSRSHDMLSTLENIFRVEIARLGIQTNVEHTSDRVAIALDYASSRCPTEYLLTTHVDLLPKHRGVVSKLRQLCSEASPIG